MNSKEIKMGTPYKNNKTGNIYYPVMFNIINATNANNGQRMVLYVDKSESYFVREEEEFLNKFSECKMYELGFDL